MRNRLGAVQREHPRPGAGLVDAPAIYGPPIAFSRSMPGKTAQNLKYTVKRRELERTVIRQMTLTELTMYIAEQEELVGAGVPGGSMAIGRRRWRHGLRFSYRLHLVCPEAVGSIMWIEGTLQHSDTKIGRRCRSGRPSR